MQNLGFIGLVLAYSGLAALLLSLYFFSDWRWWIKAIATLGVAWFFTATYLSMPPLLGWPTDHGIPKQFRLIAFSVDENNGVYIWANDLSKGVQVGTPRAYRLPYDKVLHENVLIAGRKLQRGIGIVGEMTIVDPSTVQQSDDQTEVSTSGQKFTFLDAPEDLIPRIPR